MKKYFKERFEAQRHIAAKVASSIEVNEILEKLRKEARAMVPSAMEVCILMIDPDAPKYTRPLQCALYDRPVNCLSCKRNRRAVQKALDKKKGVVISSSEQIKRPNGTLIQTGPEMALPITVNNDILGIINLVSRPGTRFTRKDFYLMRDLSETAGNLILRTKKQWEITQDKIKISQMLAHLSPFVPQSVRRIVEHHPEMLDQEKKNMDVSVLFLDLEGYTQLTSSRPETEVNEMVEKMFSSFVDPIHRSGGDINETAGDGLMIIFKNDDAATNASNAVKAAFDIHRMNIDLNKRLSDRFDPINVNIGINSGTALVGMTRFKGSLDTRMTYTASGSVTNIAARLADYAKGGDMVIGETTEKMIKGLWPVFELGAVHLKGIDQAMRVYSLKERESIPLLRSQQL